MCLRGFIQNKSFQKCSLGKNWLLPFQTSSIVHRFPLFFHLWITPPRFSPCPLTLLCSSTFIVSSHPPPFLPFFSPVPRTTDIRYSGAQPGPIHLYTALHFLISPKPTTATPASFHGCSALPISITLHPHSGAGMYKARFVTHPSPAGSALEAECSRVQIQPYICCLRKDDPKPPTSSNLHTVNSCPQ